MTHILVTGGSGFIGQHLVAAFHAQGCRVRILDLRPPAYAGAVAQYVKGSILDEGLVNVWDNRDAFDAFRRSELYLSAVKKLGEPQEVKIYEVPAYVDSASVHA